MIIAYYGKGKGKTSACIGQAARAVGSGLTVAFGQFMKRPGVAGEQLILRQLLGDNFFAAGAGFFREPGQYASQREKALDVLGWASGRPGSMLILDEALLALERGLIEKSELEPFLEIAARPDHHLVLSGPLLPKWLFQLCDIATEMRMARHAHKPGIPATRGIEY